MGDNDKIGEYQKEIKDLRKLYDDDKELRIQAKVKEANDANLDLKISKIKQDVFDRMGAEIAVTIKLREFEAEKDKLTEETQRLTTLKTEKTTALDEAIEDDTK